MNKNMKIGLSLILAGKTLLSINKTKSNTGLFTEGKYNKQFIMPRLYHPVWGNTFIYHKENKRNNSKAEEIGRKIQEAIEEMNGTTLLPISAITGSNTIKIKLKPMNNIKKAYSMKREIKYAVGKENVRIYEEGDKIVVEIPNKGETVLFGDFMQNPEYRLIKSKTTVPIGQNEVGENVYGDIAKMPHMLVAGQTGSGKSVFLNTIITALLFKNSPNDLKMILIDPKMVEFDRFKTIHHVKYVSETSEAVNTLEKLTIEMDKRYAIFAQAGCRDIDDYNEIHSPKMPRILLVIDELADMMGNKHYKKGVEQNIARIAQKSRASGIHMILATQRPSTNIITGVIKANIPCRVALRVFSNIDSRVILDKGGAELLNGYGDMLYIDGQSPKITRLQGGFITKGEMNNLIYQLVKDNQPDNNMEFDLSKEPVEFVKAYKEYYGKSKNVMYK